jgi:hypothetical protein
VKSEEGKELRIATFFFFSLLLFLFSLVIVLCSLSCYIALMSITQTVEIPASRRRTIDVPPEVPAGRAVLTFTPEAAVPERKKEREFGCAKGKYRMADDFDAPLEDLKDYM